MYAKVSFRDEGREGRKDTSAVLVINVSFFTENKSVIDLICTAIT